MLGLWKGPWPRSGYLHRMTDGRRGTGLGGQASPAMGCLCSTHQNTCQAGIWDRKCPSLTLNRTPPSPRIFCPLSLRLGPLAILAQKE